MSTTLTAREARVLRSARECAEQCDVTRARRTEPDRPLVEMLPGEQAMFWRRVPILLAWLRK